MAYNDINGAIIVPVHNERASLPELLQAIAVFINLKNISAECVVVDDASTDGSQEYLTAAKETYHWLRPCFLPQRQGKSKALEAGIEHSRGDLVLMMDGDLQNNPSDFSPMLQAMQAEGLDMVVGWRQHRKDRFGKCMASRIYNFLLNALSGMKLHDHNCGIKVVKRNMLQSLPLKGDWHRYITVLGHCAGYKVGEQVVEHEARRYGKSRYGVGRYIKILCDLPRVYAAIRKRRGE